MSEGLAKAWEKHSLGIRRHHKDCLKVWWPQGSLTSHYLGLSDSPRKTHTGGSPWALLPASTGRALCSSLCPSKLIRSPSQGQLISSVGYGAPPRRSLSRPPLQAGTASMHCRRGAHHLACHSAMARDSRRYSKNRTGSQHPRPPGPPSPAPIRAAPAQPVHPGSGRRGQRSRARARPPSRRGLQGHPPGVAPFRAPADPRRTYLPSQVSRLRSVLPPPPSALTWVAGKLAVAPHGSPPGTHFLAPRSAALYLAEAPPRSGLAWRVRPSMGPSGNSAQVPSLFCSPVSWKCRRAYGALTRPQSSSSKSMAPAKPSLDPRVPSSVIWNNSLGSLL